MNTQNKTAQTQGNTSTNNPLLPLQFIPRNKASLLNPAIGLNVEESLLSIGELLAVLQELTNSAATNEPHVVMGMHRLMDIMQSAISYETQQEAK
ncbi:hypothetical protein JYT79_00080 [Cardiobacterium sp. AH-315-I02]|nr:hypothetical protein [Cardiobacterium sp. AH-315-I02]